MAKKFSVYTLGCRVNHCESAAMEDSARAAGLEVVEWGSPADYAVVNSCALTVLAEAKTRRAIRAFARANPASAIALVGCCAQTDPEKFARIENVKWVIATPAKAACVKIMLENPAAEKAQIFCAPAPAPSHSCETPLTDRMNLKIQDGCDNACSYCIIPRARGKPVSRDFEEIVGEARNMARRGVREISLAGINISKFSSPRGTLLDVIDAIDAIPELLRIRLGSIEPPEFFLDGLLERIADPSHKLAPHLHISAQSLSDKVLGLMRRNYGAAEFLRLVEKIKSVSEDISVGTDIICGHPGEGREEFLQTECGLVESGVSYAHVFTFSPRPKTLAATMKDTPPPDERKARSDRLRDVSREISDRFLGLQRGKIRRVLLENRLKSGEYLGRTDNFIQVAVKIDADGLKNRLADVEILGRGGIERAAARFAGLV